MNITHRQSSRPLSGNALFRWLFVCPIVVLGLNWIQCGQSFAQNAANQIVVTLDIKEQSTLAAGIDGFINDFRALPGQQFSAGQLVLSLDSREIELELEKAKSELAALSVIADDESPVKSVQARLRSAQENLEQLQDASDRTRIPYLEFVRARSSVDELAAELRRAQSEGRRAKLDREAKRADIRLLDARLEKTRLLSPYAGSVADVFQFKGDFVSKGAPIAVLVRMDQLSGVALIDRSVLPPESAIGKQVQIDWNSDSMPKSSILSIKRVGPQLDAADAYRVYFDVDNVRNAANNQWVLLPGMSVSGKILDKPASIGQANKTSSSRLTENLRTFTKRTAKSR